MNRLGTRLVAPLVLGALVIALWFAAAKRGDGALSSAELAPVSPATPSPSLSAGQVVPELVARFPFAAREQGEEKLAGRIGTSDAYARLLYLHYNAKKQVAVVNHDGEAPRRTQFVHEGDTLLDGVVIALSHSEIVVKRPDGTEKVIPYLGIAEAAAPIERPFDARVAALPRVFSPGYDHAKEAEINAIIQRRDAAARKLRRRRGGAGRGSGRNRGGAVGPGNGQTRGRRARLQPGD